MRLIRTLGLALIFAASGCYCHNPTSGQKVGHVVKIAREGVFNRTWECQIVRGSMGPQGGAFGVAPFNFTATHPEDVATLKRAMLHNCEIQLDYEMPLITPSWTAEFHVSEGFATRVAILNPDTCASTQGDEQEL